MYCQWISPMLHTVVTLCECVCVCVREERGKVEKRERLRVRDGVKERVVLSINLPLFVEEVQRSH